MSNQATSEGQLTTRYQDVKHETTEEYFRGNQFSIDAFIKKYTVHDDETYVEAIKRVCDFVASCEKTEDLKSYWSSRWFDEIYNDWWHPAGSIMQGAASGRKISLCNCTVVSLGTDNDRDLEWDSLESIIKNTAYTVAKSAAYRQGLGVDFSRLRPRYATVLNSSRESSGAVHWMKFIDSIGYYVGQKGRIPAMLFSLSCSHPDVEEFIKVKGDYTQIQNANISVQCTDAFYSAVARDEDWFLSFVIPEVHAGDMVFVDTHSKNMDVQYDSNTSKWYYIAKQSRKPETVSRMVPARALMELIAKSMFEHAEPGIQNIDIARRYSNSDYVYDSNAEYDSRICGTNACQPDFATVITPSGIALLKNVNIGDTIWSGKRWTRIVNKWCSGNKEVLEYRTTRGSFVGTKDHNVFCKNTKLRVDCCPTIDAASGPNHSKMDIIPSEVMRGLMIGDGSCHNIRGLLNPFILHIGYKDGDYHQSEVANLIVSQSGSTVAWYVNVNLEPSDLPHTYNREIPKDVLYGGPQKAASFLRGLFSANGNILLKHRRIALKQSSRKLIDQAQELLSYLGIMSYVTINKAVKIKFKNGEYTSKQSYNLNISSDRFKFHELIGFIQQYKQRDLEATCEDVSACVRGKKNSNAPQSIISFGMHDVYELTVDDEDHTYWTGGILASNCSEQYLSRESLCVLSSANAGRFSSDPIVFRQEIKKISYSMNRFLDNVNEMELISGTYATPHQRLAIESLRRTGAGITNIGGWLFKHGLEYGTPNGNAVVEQFVKEFNYFIYESSIQLGHEKGSFGLFNRLKFERSPFVQRMMSLGLEFTAMRNVTGTSIAPCGTLSLMFRELVASYGIEPPFGLYFWKRTRISGKYEYYFCVPSIVRNLFKERGLELPIEQDAVKDSWDGNIGRKIADIIDNNKDRLDIRFRSSAEISPLEKLDLMAKVMQWCDSSISVTYMLPESSSWKDVYEFILEAHKREVKSIAAFPDRKMYGIVSSIPFKQLAIDLTNSKVDIHRQNFNDEEFAELRSMSAQIIPVKITHTLPPRRPRTLDCDVHHIKIIKRLDKIRTLDYLVVVGLLDDEPYEVFAMENGELDRKYVKGTISKVRRGVYRVTFADGTKIEDITKDTTEEEDIFTRMTSTSLRHGADIKFVVEQLEKAEGDMGSFGKAMARALKKYIPNGEPIKGECPKCGGNMVRQEGCRTCTLCEYSACN